MNEAFYVYCRKVIPKLDYEHKFIADQCFNAWAENPEIYKPGSGGQKKCQKIIDKLWKAFTMKGANNETN